MTRWNPNLKHWWQAKTVGELLGLYSEEQSQAVLALKGEQQRRKRNDRHRRRMTVAGAVVGGLVAGPAGAVGVGLAENTLNRTAPGKLTINEMNERHRQLKNLSSDISDSPNT